MIRSFIAATLLLTASTAMGTPILDQSAVRSAGRPGLAIQKDGQIGGQTFIPGITGVIGQIDLQLYRRTASVSGPVTLELHDVELGFPATDAPLFALVFDASILPVFDDPFDTTVFVPLTTFDLSSFSVGVVSGTRYALVVTSAANDWVVWVSLNGYEDGASYIRRNPSSPWQPLGGDEVTGGDLGFRTYAVPEPGTLLLVIPGLAFWTARARSGARMSARNRK